MGKETRKLISTEKFPSLKRFQASIKMVNRWIAVLCAETSEQEASKMAASSILL